MQTTTTAMATTTVAESNGGSLCNRAGAAIHSSRTMRCGPVHRNVQFSTHIEGYAADPPMQTHRLSSNCRSGSVISLEKLVLNGW